MIITFSLSATLANAQCLQGNCTDGTDTYRYSTGTVYTENFKNNKSHGTGEVVCANSDSYHDKYKDGKKEWI